MAEAAKVIENIQRKKIEAQRIRALGKANHVIYDIKYLLPSDQVNGRL